MNPLFWCRRRDETPGWLKRLCRSYARITRLEALRELLGLQGRAL